MPKRIRRKKCRPSAVVQYMNTPYVLLRSAAARHLSPAAFKVLFYVRLRYDGFNNGQIGFGARSGCYVPVPNTPYLENLTIGLKPRTVSDALGELERAGFLVCTKPSSFGQKRLTKEWRLTFEGTKDVPIPSREYMRITGPCRKPKAPKKQKPERVATLQDHLQSAQAPSHDADTVPNGGYRATARSGRKSYRAAGRPHIVTMGMGHLEGEANAVAEPVSQPDVAPALSVSSSPHPMGAQAVSGPTEQERSGAHAQFP